MITPQQQIQSGLDAIALDKAVRAIDKLVADSAISISDAIDKINRRQRWSGRIFVKVCEFYS